MLALIAIYRLPDFVSGVMANPLYIDLGFSKSDIATVSKVYGVWIGIAGRLRRRGGGGAARPHAGFVDRWRRGVAVASRDGAARRRAARGSIS